MYNLRLYVICTIYFFVLLNTYFDVLAIVFISWYFFLRLSFVVWFSIFFPWFPSSSMVVLFYRLLLVWRKRILSTVGAVSIRYISCNPLITGVIRDIMFTFIAEISYIPGFFPITTIVSNRNIFRKGTTLAVTERIRTNGIIRTAIAWSFSDDGIFHRVTRMITLARSIMNGRIFHMVTRDKML